MIPRNIAPLRFFLIAMLVYWYNIRVSRCPLIKIYHQTRPSPSVNTFLEDKS